MCRSSGTLMTHSHNGKVPTARKCSFCRQQKEIFLKGIENRFLCCFPKRVLLRATNENELVEHKSPKYKFIPSNGHSNSESDDEYDDPFEYAYNICMSCNTFLIDNYTASEFWQGSYLPRQLFLELKKLGVQFNRLSEFQNAYQQIVSRSLDDIMWLIFVLKTKVTQYTYTNALFVLTDVSFREKLELLKSIYQFSGVPPSSGLLTSCLRLSDKIDEIKEAIKWTYSVIAWEDDYQPLLRDQPYLLHQINSLVSLAGTGESPELSCILLNAFWLHGEELAQWIHDEFHVFAFDHWRLMIPMMPIDYGTSRSFSGEAMRVISEFLKKFERYINLYELPKNRKKKSTYFSSEEQYSSCLQDLLVRTYDIKIIQLLHTKIPLPLDFLVNLLRYEGVEFELACMMVKWIILNTTLSLSDLPDNFYFRHYILEWLEEGVPEKRDAYERFIKKGYDD